MGLRVIRARPTHLLVKCYWGPWLFNVTVRLYGSIQNLRLAQSKSILSFNLCLMVTLFRDLLVYKYSLLFSGICSLLIHTTSVHNQHRSLLNNHYFPDFIIMHFTPAFIAAIMATSVLGAPTEETSKRSTKEVHLNVGDYVPPVLSAEALANLANITVTPGLVAATPASLNGTVDKRATSRVYFCTDNNYSGVCVTWQANIGECCMVFLHFIAFSPNKSQTTSLPRSKTQLALSHPTRLRDLCACTRRL